MAWRSRFYLTHTPQSPTCVTEEGAVYWIDIEALALHRLGLATLC